VRVMSFFSSVDVHVRVCFIQALLLVGWTCLGV
jgi:hypothetical protein